MKNLFLFALAFSLFAGRSLFAQNVINPYEMHQNEESHWADADSVKKEGIPVGQFVWSIEPRFGSIRPAQPDTLHHLFNRHAFTEGIYGHYNTTGNLGSPRQSRMFFEQGNHFLERSFIFEHPYDFFITQPEQLLFTNTKSPFTNISYHSCGNKQNGEDRIRTLYYVNVNKRLGLGFKIDYLYGRGYYASQSTAHFNGTLYGSYRGERYEMHAQYYANHLKNSENGGLEEDTYLTRPESFPTKYGTADMPTRLSKTWNKLNVNTLHLTHRYNWGFLRYKDEEGNVVSTSSVKIPGNLNQLVGQIPDSLDAVPDAANDSTLADSTKLGISEFVPVLAAIHTMRVDHNNRRFLSNLPASENHPVYFKDYYLPGDSASDFTKYLHVGNTLALELVEGFNKWARSGVKLFARHDFFRFTLPSEQRFPTAYHENHFAIGTELQRRKGKRFSYNLLGELRGTEKHWGDFNAEGNAQLALPLKKDTLTIAFEGYVRGEQPSFYYRHYHARNAWWDQSLSRVFRAKIGATASYKKTRLSLQMETIQNYTYFAEQTLPHTTPEGLQLPLYGVSVKQKSGNLQLLSACLQQDFKWGPLHWENELTTQISSDKESCPLPLLSVYSNLYFRFTIAKVLHTELGADATYFTEYEAPAYSPIIGQYCVQDAAQRVKIGNYPVVNAYANFSLQHTRFYVMLSHVNASAGSGNPFLVPHYPMNQMIIRFGLSWNFFN